MEGNDFCIVHEIRDLEMISFESNVVPFNTTTSHNYKKAQHIKASYLPKVVWHVLITTSQVYSKTCLAAVLIRSNDVGKTVRAR